MIAVPWYDNADVYTQMLSAAEDCSVLFESYGDWHREAIRLIENLTFSGFNVLKVSYAIGDWVDWCNQKSLPRDENSRSEYVAKLAKSTEPIHLPTKKQPKLGLVSNTPPERNH